ncbi:ABC transporter permease [Streptomyces sp. NPDC048639]|uniref:ABC transporter permease n=1 Tax=Streptomyces sp. NPDC048639 TaxID=3365581 RepID=UPI00371ABC96
MTAVADVPAARAGGSRNLAGTGTLMRLALRRDRVMLPVWVAVVTIAVVNSVEAIKSYYGSAADRADLARSMTANGSLRALYGPVFSDSVGGLTAWRMVGYAGVFAGIMSLLIVVRHTREEEETGRQEMLSSAVVGRRAPLTSAILAALTANALIALLITLGLIGSDQPAGGSLALGLAIAGQGLCFAGVAAVTAQLTESARAARSLAGAAVGLAFMLRAAGDAATADGSSLLTWISPVGWGENVRAFADNRWPVLLLLYAAAALTAAVAYVLAGRRDIGASFLPARPGAPAAPGRLNGPYGLAWRLQRGSLLGWSLGFAAAGVVFGSMTDGVADLVGDSESTRQVLERMGGRQGITDSFLAGMIGMLGMVAAIYAVGCVMRLRGEETAERAEPVLAGAVSRLHWAASHLVFAFAGTVVVMLSGGLGMGLGHGLAVEDIGGQMPPVLGAALAQLPAAWALAAVAMLLFGAVPKASVAGWAVAGACLAIGWLGPALNVPQGVMDLSPFGHLPKLPGGEVAAAPYVWMPALTALMTAAGLAALRRRDLSQ